MKTKEEILASTFEKIENYIKNNDIDTSEVDSIAAILRSNRRTKDSIRIKAAYQSFRNMKQTNLNDPDDSNSEFKDGKLEIDKILQNPVQPRKDFTENDIIEKMNSIRNIGLIQPITIIKANDGKYYLVAGQLRLEAFKRLHKEEILQGINPNNYKYNKISIHLSDTRFSNKNIRVRAIVENTNRTKMPLLNTSFSLKESYEEQELTLREFAKTVGMSKSTLHEYLAIAELDKEIIDFIEANDITSKTAAYTISKQNLEPTQAIKLLKDFKDGKISIDQFKDKNDSVSLPDKTNDSKKSLTPIQEIHTFKKSLDMKKYKKLDNETKNKVDENINKILELQKSIIDIIN